MYMRAILRRPESWTATAAIFALVLSQLPPLSELYARYRTGPDIQLSAGDDVRISHFLGYLDLLIFLDLRNAGGIEVDIVKLDSILKEREGDRVLKLPARVMTLPGVFGGARNYLAFHGLTMKPGDFARADFSFRQVLSELDDEKAANLTDKVGRTPKADTDPGILREVQELVKAQFRLSRGAYQWLIAALDRKGRILAVRGWEFTIYESTLRTLLSGPLIARSASRDGNGLYYISYSRPVYPKLHSIDDTRAGNLYEALRRSGS